MTDNDLFAGKLRDLAADDVYVGGKRFISQGEWPLPLQAILCEIDNTVLERELTFYKDGAEISLMVAGRRLKGVTRTSGVGKGAETVTGKVMSRDDKDLLKAVTSMVKKFAGLDGLLCVQTGPATKLGRTTDVGLSVKSLAKAWRVELSVEAPDPMTRFLLACGTLVPAALLDAGEPSEEMIGDPSIVAKLQAIHQGQLRQFSDHCDVVRADYLDQSLVCLENALGASDSVGVANFGGRTAIFMYDSEKKAEILFAWRGLSIK